MRKVGITVAVLASALGMWGCAGDVGDAGGMLRAVDEGAMTSQVLYMVPDVSAIPLTAAQLDEEGIDVTLATPVRVEIFDEVAVAWFAPDGEAIVSRSSIVAMWQVVNRQPTAGEVANDPGASGTVYTPPTDVLIATFEGQTTTNETRLVDGVEEQVAVTTPVEQTIIDFFDRVGTPEEAIFIEWLSTYHPGCI